MKLKKLIALAIAALVLVSGVYAGGNSQQSTTGKAKDELVAGVSNLSTAIDPMLANFATVSDRKSVV
jgi:hypothetical protein